MTTDDDIGCRISSEEAVAAIGNRYDLVIIGAKRMRELSRGDLPKVATKNGHCVTALKEIVAGKIGREYLSKELGPEPRRRYKDHDRF
jgi:DNA-directed RNA polymerase subunit omega